MPVTIKWGRERISFDLPAPDTTLGAVRRSLAQYTHLPEHAFKLIHAGALMKDDTAPISAYHLHPNSTIALIGSADPLPVPTKSEQSVINTIQAELSKVRTDLTPSVEIFLSTTPHQSQEKEHFRLGELLLQSLIRLDGVATDAEWEEARKERKTAVREVQTLLDRLDDGWANRNAG